MQQQEMKRREELEAKLAERGQKGVRNRERKLEERVKSMAELRRRKEEYTASRLKESRREELKRSLEKIRQIEKEREDLLASKLTRTEGALSQSLSLSRLHKRNQDHDAKYQAMLLQLQSKGIFADPSRKGLSELYAQRAKIVREKSREHSEEAHDRLGAKLEKIEGAR